MSKTTATLVRRTSLTESSLIVHWCSGDLGLIKTIAKGARRKKSPFAGKLDLFYRCEIEIVPAKKGDLHILKDLAVERPRLGIRRTYLQTLAAACFVRMIEKVAEAETPIPELADLLERALDFLDEEKPDRRAVRHFEEQLCEILGLSDPKRDPAECIAETFGNLPKQRVELFEQLKG